MKNDAVMLFLRLNLLIHSQTLQKKRPSQKKKIYIPDILLLKFKRKKIYKHILPQYLKTLLQEEVLNLQLPQRMQYKHQSKIL